MDTLKKREGFESERLLVLPEYVLEDMAEHELVRGLYLTDIGHFPRAAHHYRERPEGIDSNILIYCADGEGWVELQADKPVPLKRHMLTVIPAGTPHRYGASEHEPWSIYWFHFKGAHAAAFIAEYGLNAGALEVPLSSFVKFAELFDQCYGMLTAKTYSRSHHIQVSQTIRYLLSTVGLTAARSRQDERREQYLDRAIRYMTEHIAGSMTLPELAAYTGLSRQHLIHLFNQSVGYPPIDYFLRMKIQRAGQMLDLTDLSVKEICSSLGFQDPYYFSRMFKKVMGCSPTAYRRIQKG